jgi:hypothetical protein
VRALADNPNKGSLASIVFFQRELVARVVRRQDMNRSPGFIRKLAFDVTDRDWSHLDCADSWMLKAHVRVYIGKPTFFE